MVVASPNRETKQLSGAASVLGNRLVAGKVGGVEIIQKAAALADHFQEAAPRTVVLDVFLQMFGQMVDPFGQKGDLHISRPGVALVNRNPAIVLPFSIIVLSIKCFDRNCTFGRAGCKVLFQLFLEGQFHSFGHSL